jgi:hypothetical protein
MSSRRRLLAIALIAAAAALAGSYTWSAYIATSTNDDDSIASGTVSLTDNDSDTALLSLSAAQPGASDTGCIEVRYAGSLASTVRLYGSTSGSGLDQYLDLEITRGVYSPSDPSFDSCTNFQADSTNYIGAGSGVIYDGTLQAFPDSYAAGLVDPTSGSPESWTNGEERVYRIQVTLQNNSSAEGLDATQTFTWEARNQ